MRVLIVDDEPLAQTALANVLAARVDVEHFDSANDAVEAIEMADFVLRHSGLPFIGAGEQGRGAEADDLLQFGANDGDDGVVGEIPDIFGV